MHQIKSELNTQLSEIEGAFIEDKDITLSVHYRLVAKDNESLFKTIFDKICSPYYQERKITIYAGKKVLDIRPPVDWNKGQAILWFIRKQEISFGAENIFPIYIGDDATDIDAFRAIKNIGIGICVGQPEIAPEAQYYLDDPQAVTAFLHLLVKLTHEEL